MQKSVIISTQYNNSGSAIAQIFLETCGTSSVKIVVDNGKELKKSLELRGLLGEVKVIRRVADLDKLLIEASKTRSSVSLAIVGIDSVQHSTALAYMKLIKGYKYKISVLATCSNLYSDASKSFKCVFPKSGLYSVLSLATGFRFTDVYKESEANYTLSTWLDKTFGFTNKLFKSSLAYSK